MTWTPSKEEHLSVSALEKALFDAGDPASAFLDYRFPTLKGINKRGEFPVAVARRALEKRGCTTFVSAQSKHGIPCYLLERLPGVRRRGDSAYATMIEAFTRDALDEFHRKASVRRRREGLKSAGGDPDLFVVGPRGRRFFVEVKLEDLSRARPYRDRLGQQQHVLFPLIESELSCDVWLFTVTVQGAW